MRRYYLALALALALAIAPRADAIVLRGGASVITTPTGDYTFTPLTTYYMDPAGNDSNNGLSQGAPWLTPNHAVNCGDVIIAVPGTYRAAGFGTFGTVSGCPSASGGIDGAGGVYFATILCGGNLGSCSITYTGGGGTGAFQIQKSNWAVSGWSATTTGTNAFCYMASSTSGAAIWHHIAFVNNICATAGIGYATNDNGINHTVPGNGIDYFAVVGNIAQNADKRSDFPSAAIVNVGPANSDTNAGVHSYMAANFLIANQTVSGASDGEGMMLDSWDVHGYVGTGVIEDNVNYNSGWAGLQIFEQSFNSSAPIIYVNNNTFYNSGVFTPFSVGATGGINLQLNGGFPWTVNVKNNISQTVRTTVGGSGAGALYGLLGGAASIGSLTLNVGGSGTENVIKGARSSCGGGGTCDAGFNQIIFNGLTFGTNTFTDPLFTNTSDLLTNHVGAPACSSFGDVASCMGWNFGTQTASALSVIGDIAATAGAASGKGYRPPAPCAANTNYPTWLKGVVYLSWNSGSGVITEKAGLANKPCNL